MNDQLSTYFRPNDKPRLTIVFVFWTAVAVSLWLSLKPAVFPNPLEVLGAFPGLWTEGLGDAVITSFAVNVEAILLSVLIGLPLCYLSRLPVVAPVALFVAKLRFVGSAALYLPLLFLTSGGHWLKLSLLTFAMLFSLVTTLTGVVDGIPEEKFDDARTLRMSEWTGVWYVVIRGTVAEVIDAIRDNAAAGWSMLMFVEGLVRSEGGVGVLLYNQQKHMMFPQITAIILTILAVGIAQDWLMGQVRKAACPYA